MDSVFYPKNLSCQLSLLDTSINSITHFWIYRKYRYAFVMEKKPKRLTIQ